MVERQTLPEEAAEHYGMTVPELYLQVTGQPIWWDLVGRKALRAHRKWDRFLVAFANSAVDDGYEEEEESTAR